MRALFVGTYTTKEAHVSGEGRGIYVYGLPPSPAAPTSPVFFKSLTIVDQLNPSFVLVSSNKQWLFAVAETGGPKDLNRVYAYKIQHDPDDGMRLPLHASYDAHGVQPCYLEEYNGYLIVSNYTSGNVSCYAIDYTSDQLLNYVSTIQFSEHSSVDALRQEAAHAHSTLVLSEVNRVLVCDLGADCLHVLAVRADGGGLSQPDDSRRIRLRPGAGPRHMALSPDRRHVYVVCELSSEVYTYCYRPEDNDASRWLTEAQPPVSTVFGASFKAAADYSFQNSADLHMTACGRFLYASNRGKQNSIAAFRVDPTTGALTPIAGYSVEGLVPRNFVISPEDEYLLVGKQDSHNILPFTIDKKTGELTAADFEVTCPNPVCLKIVDF